MTICFSKYMNWRWLYDEIPDDRESFYNSIDRISAPDWLPDDQDILRVRLRTTGISEIFFDMDHITWSMIDVGGQRSERKKWIHCFENVDCLIFVAALSGYDQCLVEDHNAVCPDHFILHT